MEIKLTLHPDDLAEILSHVHHEISKSVCGQLDTLTHELKSLRRQLEMAKQDLLAAVAASTAEVKQHITDTGARVTADLNTLTATVADLTTKVGDVLTQADIDPIIAANKDLVTSVDAIDPATPPPVAVTPA